MEILDCEDWSQLKTFLSPVLLLPAPSGVPIQSLELHCVTEMIQVKISF